MSKVLVTSKTKMSRGYCVGGYDIEHRCYIRLLNRDGTNQQYNTDFEIGELWELEYQHRTLVTPPHIEDILITEQRYISDIDDISEYIQNVISPQTGCITTLFDNKLAFTSNYGAYISDYKGLPLNSVGFWLIPKALHLIRGSGDKIRYQVEGERYNIPYVGLETAISSIPAGTLVRVSLARWWSPDPGEFEDRCYMQLSGWY